MNIARVFPVLLLLALLGTTLSGCARQAMDYSISSWQNEPVSEVITSWGPPSEELRVNGKHLLLWNSPDRKAVLPTDKNAVQRTAAIGCVRLLEVDKGGRVITGTWDGEDCPGWFSGWYW